MAGQKKEEGEEKTEKNRKEAGRKEEREGTLLLLHGSRGAKAGDAREKTRDKFDKMRHQKILFENIIL